MTQTEKNESIFWKKKEYISFLLSILVFFIHSYFARESSGSLISVINHKTAFFFSRSITQFAVPMFFMLSGLTFFKGYENRKYPAKIRSRLFTLVIPYLLWNTVWMLWEIFCSYSFLSAFSESAERFPLTFESILKGIFFYGCNVPFWFIFDIIVLSFAAPLIFLVICNKYVGIFSVVLLSVLSVYGIHVPEALFYYPTSIVFYLMGGIVGYHYFGFASRRSSKTERISSAVILFVYVLLKNIVPEKLQIDNYLAEIIVFTICSVALWNIVDGFIEKIKPRAIYRRSFAIYAMHLNVALIVLKILSFVLPASEWVKIPEFVLMVVLTLMIINFVCAFLERFFPRIYGIFMGNRIKK